MTKKNGTIELMRFIFAVCMVLYYVSGDLWSRSKVFFTVLGYKVFIFRYGYIGAEFFFIVAGYLLAGSVYKKISVKDPVYDNSTCAKDWLSFISKKVRRLLPYYWPVSMVLILLLITIDRVRPSYLFYRLPSLFFLQRSGLYTEGFIGVSFYLSSMLIAMAVIYPFLRRFYFSYTRWFGPVAGCLIIGTMIYYTGSLGGAADWFGFTYKTNIRAFAEISMGTGCFELARFLKDKKYSDAQRVILSLVSALCYLSAFVFACFNVDRSFGGQVLYLLCIAVTISFSEIGIVGYKGWLQKPLFGFLGAISLPFFLSQNIFRKIVPVLCREMDPKYQFMVILAVLFAFSCVFCLVVERVKKLS